MPPRPGKIGQADSGAPGAAEELGVDPGQEKGVGHVARVGFAAGPQIALDEAGESIRPEGVPTLARLVVEAGAPRLARKNVSRSSSLTKRESEVLRCIARGLSEKDIAQTMHISPHTVHRHTSSLKAKLDIHNRVELARYAIREGLADACAC